jgi:hypothetical protein
MHRFGSVALLPNEPKSGDGDHHCRDRDGWPQHQSNNTSGHDDDLSSHEHRCPGTEGPMACERCCKRRDHPKHERNVAHHVREHDAEHFLAARHGCTAGCECPESAERGSTDDQSRRREPAEPRGVCACNGPHHRTMLQLLTGLNIRRPAPGIRETWSLWPPAPSHPFSGQDAGAFARPACHMPSPAPRRSMVRVSSRGMPEIGPRRCPYR